MFDLPLAASAHRELAPLQRIVLERIMSFRLCFLLLVGTMVLAQSDDASHLKIKDARESRLIGPSPESRTVPVHANALSSSGLNFAPAVLYDSAGYETNSLA